MKSKGKANKKQKSHSSTKSNQPSNYADNHIQRRNIAYILRKMKEGKVPSKKQLAKEMSVCDRTIRRYFAIIKTELELSAKFDPQSKTFKFDQEFASSNISVTEKEMIAMTVAKKDLAHRQAAGLDRSITSAFKKIVSNASARVVKKIKDWERIISFRMSGETVTDPYVFDTLVKAAGYQRKLDIGYKDPEGNVTDRTIDPLHISNVNGDWYLFAFDYLRNGIRTFCPCRIKTIEHNGETFEWPDEWDVDTHLAKSFGVVEGIPGKEYHTVIRFKKRVADFIREKKWKGQTGLVELPDGGVELRQTLNGLFELQLWVMKWGQNALVVSPPELREMVYQEAKAMACLYENNDQAA